MHALTAHQRNMNQNTVTVRSAKDRFEAAFTALCARSDRVLELLIAGPGIFRFVSAGRVGYFEEVLDILAAVEPCSGDPLPDLLPLLMEEIRAIQSVCLVLGHWNAYRAALVQSLNDCDVGVKVILVSRRGTAPASLPPGSTYLNVQAIKKGEVTTL